MNRQIFLFIAAWMLITSLSLVWNLSIRKHSEDQIVVEGARAFFHQILLTRAWNAGFGGVYVPVSENIHPNPWLEDVRRDVMTADGVRLTKINPAFMTRQISEIAMKQKGVKFHITSCRPIRPENQPDEWETAALRAFETGIPEVWEYIPGNQEAKYRYMAPLLVEESCMKCHGKQGYRPGEVRGGISITVPAPSSGSLMPLWLTHLFIGILGAVCIFFTGKRIEHSRMELTRAKEAAESASRMKSAFIANMSHEIRTPMNAILGFSEILGEKITAPDQRQNLESIRMAGKALLRLLSDVLDISRMESGKLTPEYRIIHLPVFIDEIRQISGPGILEKKLDFFVETDPELPPVILQDENRLRQILLNLLGNAVKFTDTGYVRFSVACRYPKNGHTLTDLVFTVEDSGIGIAENEAESIFLAFEQQKGQSNEKYGGTGLGLAVSRRMAQLINGKIEVSSQIGKGSIFVLTLRDVELASPQLPEDLEKQSEKKDYCFEKARILIADDLRINRSLIRGFLERYGFDFIEAENGRESIRLARQYLPDLILMDMKMPVTDGLEAMRIIRKDRKLKQIPIIAMSGSAAGEDRNGMQKLSNACLSKPVSRAELVSLLASFLAHTVISETEISESANPGLRGDAKEIPENSPHFLPKRLPELLDILERESEIWADVSETLTINEVSDFASRMKRLGKEYDLKILSDWGDRLEAQSGLFDMDAIAGTLEHFPVILRQIRDAISRSSG